MLLHDKSRPWNSFGDTPNFQGPDGPDTGAVLINGEGQTVNGPLLGSSGAGGPGTGTATSSTGNSSPSPFVINISYDQNPVNLPAGFTTAVAAAVQYLESQFTDAVTININVGYGETGGSSLGAGVLGSSLTYLSSYTYSQVVSHVSADAKTATDATAVASLPASSPVNGTYWVSTAEAKALGLMGASSAVDGYVGFSSSYAFDYNNADGVTAGSYDFYGVVLHEITEVMGRMLLTGVTLGGTPNSYDLMDLFHYSAAGVRDFSAVTPGYFSIDGGTTNLGGFNTNPGGDAGDWGSGMGNDAFNAFGNSGVVDAISSADLTLLDTIGWDGAGAAPPSGPTGVAVTAATYTASMENSSGLAANAKIASIVQTGGVATDSYSYQLADSSGNFTLTNAGNAASLTAGLSGVPGATNGKAYKLSVTATDTTTPATSPPAPLGVVVGSSLNDTINIATLLGASATPAFIYGLGGNDTINGSAMTSSLWFAGGAGADTMTGGSGSDTYAYGAIGDSTASFMDVIKNFNAATDLIDLTGLGTHLSYAGKFGRAGTLAADSIGWQVSKGNTFVYVNTSGSAEGLSAANMKIELAG